MYTYSCRSPFRKGILMSTCLKGQSKERVKDNINPTDCNKPFVTRRALYVSTEPFVLCLILKSHLQPIDDLPGGKVV